MRIAVQKGTVFLVAEFAEQHRFGHGGFLQQAQSLIGMRCNDGPVEKAPASVLENQLHVLLVSPDSTDSTILAGASTEIFQYPTDIDLAAPGHAAPEWPVSQFEQSMVSEKMGKALEGEAEHGPGRT